MMDPAKKGKTLWEMLQERLRAGGNGAGLPFENPLSLAVGAPVLVSCANGPDFADHDFTVQEIREYTRRIEGKDYRFTDYVCRGINTKSFDASEALLVRIRVVPNPAGSHDALLLRVYDEFKFAETFLAVLKDDTGLLEISEDKSGARDSFNRINNLRESYEAAVLVITETTVDGKATPGKTSAAKLEYWDYWRDADIGAGKTAKEFVFVEMNSDTGWFQIWRGREFFR
jgi:hypothetical protein